jgi:hypothetical protein
LLVVGAGLVALDVALIGVTVVFGLTAWLADATQRAEHSAAPIIQGGRRL